MVFYRRWNGVSGFWNKLCSCTDAYLFAVFSASLRRYVVNMQHAICDNLAMLLAAVDAIWHSTVAVSGLPDF